MAHKILVVDDDPDCRSLIAAHLRSWGYEVLCASCGREALDLLCSKSFDMAIVDLYMEDLSGLDVLAEIRRRPTSESMPVLIISSEQDPSSMAVALDFGADDYLIKPIDPSWLRAKVQRCLPETTVGQEPLPPGSRWGPYEIQCLMTSGNGHRTYRAQDVRLKRLVRLKVIPGNDSEDLAEREALALARIHHPNVETIHDFGSQPMPFIVTEYAPAVSLACLPEVATERRVLSAIKWTLEILGGLQAVHAQGLVHANLNPENVLLRNDTGGIQLTDFSAAFSPESNTQTGGRATRSSAAFVAPEQVDALFGNIGPRADLFAAAGILYFLLTGSAPFTPSLPYQQLLSIAFAPPDSPRCHNRDVPSDLEAICLRGLEKEQNLRFQTVEQFRNLLRPQLARAIRTSRPMDSRNFSAELVNA